MLKDITEQQNNTVGVAIVKEINQDLEIEWNVFVVNLDGDKIENAFVTCKGYGLIENESKETSVTRYFLEDIDEQTAVKVEPISPDLFVLNNEYALVFYQNGVMYDKKLTFTENTITENALKQIPIVDCLGVLLF